MTFYVTINCIYFPFLHTTKSEPHCELANLKRNRFAAQLMNFIVLSCSLGFSRVLRQHNIQLQDTKYGHAIWSSLNSVNCSKSKRSPFVRSIHNWIELRVFLWNMVGVIIFMISHKTKNSNNINFIFISMPILIFIYIFHLVDSTSFAYFMRYFVLWNEA